MFLFDFNNFKAKSTSRHHSLINLNLIKSKSYSSNNCLNVYYQNVRSIRKKFSNLHTNFILLTYDVIILTEI